MTTQQALTWILSHSCIVDVSPGKHIGLLVDVEHNKLTMRNEFFEPYGDPGLALIRLVQSAIAWIDALPPRPLGH
jgi:hypothetical protein